MLALQILFLVVGMLLLVKGADWFVDGSAGVAHKCKISTLVIGLTVVAFGTSAPRFKSPPKSPSATSSAAIS